MDANRASIDRFPDSLRKLFFDVIEGMPTYYVYMYLLLAVIHKPAAARQLNIFSQSGLTFRNAISRDAHGQNNVRLYDRCPGELSRTRQKKKKKYIYRKRALL